MRTLISLAVVFLALLAIASEDTSNQAMLDSLQTEYRKATHDSIKCKIYLEIGDYYEFENSDSALHYYNKCAVLAENASLFNLKGRALRYAGMLFSSQGSYDKAVIYFLKALDMFEETGKKRGIA